MQSAPRDSFWDAIYAVQGHTGWADQALYRYDQPLRMRAVATAIESAYPHGLSGLEAADIGCGTGDVIELLATRGARVTAYDPVHGAVAVARQRFEHNRRVTVEVGALPEISLRPASLDLITSVTVLQHIVDAGDIMESLSVLRAALRPAGKMFAFELAPLRGDASGVLHDYVVERSCATWLATFARAGFIVAEERYVPQVGVWLLRGLARGIDFLRAATTAGQSPAVADPGPSRTSGGTRVLARSMLAGARGGLLSVAWAFDRLSLPVVPERSRYYRLFVLKRASGAV